MSARSLRSTPPAVLLLLSFGGCYIFTEEGRPCTAEGVCKPGFTCVEGRCVTAGALRLNEPCQETEECVDDAICAVQCDEPENVPCSLASDCQPSGEDRHACVDGFCRCQKKCREMCDFPAYESCDSGQLCWRDPEQDLGFCQRGDCEFNQDCRDGYICWELNGPGSGWCRPLCTVLEQNLACQNPPADGVGCCEAGDNCEHFVELLDQDFNPGNAYGMCVPGGNVGEGSPCSNLPEDNLYCQSGMVCYEGTCLRYCRVGGGTPECNPLFPVCSAFSGTAVPIPFGICLR